MKVLSEEKVKKFLKDEIKRADERIRERKDKKSACMIADILMDTCEKEAYNTVLYNIENPIDADFEMFDEIGESLMNGDYHNLEEDPSDIPEFGVKVLCYGDRSTFLAKFYEEDGKVVCIDTPNGKYRSCNGWMEIPERGGAK